MFDQFSGPENPRVWLDITVGEGRGRVTCELLPRQVLVPVGRGRGWVSQTPSGTRLFSSFSGCPFKINHRKMNALAFFPMATWGSDFILGCGFKETKIVGR